MIYSIVGTNKEKRERANRELFKDKSVTVVIHSEQVFALEPLIDQVDLFGSAVVASLNQLMEVASSKEILIDLLPKLQESKNVFIVDEPFADANKFKKLEKYSEKVFDCREEKEGEASPFPMCNAFAKRDKKEVFLEWMKIKDVSEPLEMVHGALWWKMRAEWEGVLNGRPSKFTKRECEDFSERIVKSFLDSHRGEKDLKVELERIILSI